MVYNHIIFALNHFIMNQFSQLIACIILVGMCALALLFPPLLLIVVPGIIMGYNQVKKEQQALNDQFNKPTPKARKPRKK
jgi:hypothetical protein